MRVIGGTYRSRKLLEVDSTSTRETKDRVKESIFNSLQPYLYEARVLDLFAGSGSLGIEAISRGALSVVFVDQQTQAIHTIRKNCDVLQINNQVHVHQQDAVDHLHQTTEIFDIILLDPPYASQELDLMIEIIAQRRILTTNGIVVCLYSKKDTLKQSNRGIIEYKTKTMGITKVTFMKWGN
jgi:16S rRNA (guanine(966)-N(2))-methyltransferase RsmD